MKTINIISAKQNNLKDVSVKIPYYSLNVVTGNSGCGKSSLIYDTLYAESQRAFYESLIEKNVNVNIMQKPQVKRIEHLCPAISVSQKFHNNNPRSTVGTLTDMSQYLRSIFSHVVNFEYSANFKEGDFSFNNSRAWCLKCKGLGRAYKVDINKIILDEKRTLNQDAITYYKGNDKSFEKNLLKEVCKHYDINMDIPFNELDPKHRRVLLYSDEKLGLLVKYKNNKNRYKQKQVVFKGVITEINERIQYIDTPSVFVSINKFVTLDECNVCTGYRLKNENLKYEVCGYNYGQIECMDMSELGVWLSNVSNKYAKTNLNNFIKDAVAILGKKIASIINLKLGYLSIGRSIPTLSGGESQRLRIANQLTCSLSELLYILDEPCRGLHCKDIKTIISASKELVENGNTLIAIEHNLEYLKSADRIFLMGPGGGPNGGSIIAQGTYAEVFKEKEEDEIPRINRKYGTFIEVVNASKNNIKLQNFKIPMNYMSVITGVSGSGKSTLVEEILYPSLNNRSNVNCEKIKIPVSLKKTYLVDQSPIGKTSRSSVVSYIGIYDDIRELFARTESAREQRVTSTYFSTNCEGGRCEKCQGTGYIKLEIPFLADSYAVCDDCDGKRFTQKILNIKYKDRNIFDVLNMGIQEAAIFFKEETKIYNKLICLCEIGLEYIKLGQLSMSLSGGEAQRIKLAKYLGETIKKGSCFILDEPTAGLSESDIAKLCKIMNEIVDKGNTIICVEHNLKFVKNNADYIIDMGNYGGDKGGVIIDQGSYDEIIKNGLASICI